MGISYACSFTVVPYLQTDRLSVTWMQDLLDNADKLDGVEQLLIAHVSSRYGSYLEVLKLLVATLPCSVVKKVFFFSHRALSNTRVELKFRGGAFAPEVRMNSAGERKW